MLLLAGLISAPGAVSAEPPASPAGVPVATEGGRTLFAYDERQQLCLSFRARDGFASCEDGGSATVFDDTERATGAPGPRRLGVAVPAGAASVEVRRAGRLLATAPTQPGSRYTGKRAGRVVFAILTLPATPADGLRVRALDASGAPVAVRPAGDGDLLGPQRKLLSGRAGVTRWTLTRRRVSGAASALFDLDHETVTQCLTVTTRAGRGGGSTQGACVGGAPEQAFLGGAFGPGADAAFQDECRTGFRLVSGLAPPGSRVALVLGDGSRRVMRTAPFGTDRVAYAGTVSAGAAVRALRVTTRGRTRTVRLLAAPLRVSCAAGASASFTGGAASSRLLDLASIFSSLPVVTPEGPVTRVAGTPGFRVADGPAGSLCLATGDARFMAFGCPVVGPGYDGEIAASVEDFERPRAVVIAVPSAVASVRIGPAKGPLRTIPTVEADGYTGRYAGLVRFVAFSVGGYDDLATLELLDAAGTVLRTETASTGPGDLSDMSGPKRVGARRLAGSPGRRSLWRTTFRYDGLVQCSAITDGPAPPTAAACQGSVFGSGTPEVLLDVPCSTRRVTVAVLARRGSRVSVRDSRGRTRRLDARGGGAILELPPSVGVDAVTVRRAGKRQRIRLAAPAGARQCGYRVSAQPDLN